MGSTHLGIFMKTSMLCQICPTRASPQMVVEICSHTLIAVAARHTASLQTQAKPPRTPIDAGGPGLGTQIA